MHSRGYVIGIRPQEKLKEGGGRGDLTKYCKKPQCQSI